MDGVGEGLRDWYRSTAGYALSAIAGMQRSGWQPKLTPQQIDYVRGAFEDAERNKPVTVFMLKEAAIVVAFHARTIWSDRELAELIEKEKSGLFTEVREKLIPQLDTTVGR
jgi:hypothetical protein